MPAVYQIRFVPGGETQAFCGSRGDCYELTNGTHIGLWSSPVWCRRCNEFLHGESIETLEEIDRQIACDRRQDRRQPGDGRISTAIMGIWTEGTSQGGRPSESPSLAQSKRAAAQSEVG
jgi:hypothetical protein